ncbi:LysE family translocator [bacterium]|nr:MAG: LysE family translocator [bacterium]
MTIEQSLTAYLLAATLLTLTPGADTAIVLRAVTAEGAKPAIGASLGVALGLLVWGVLVALGLAGLLAASAVAYTALRWIGAAYLFVMGVKLLLKPRDGLDAPHAQEGNARASFTKGLVTNLLNPKVGVFYVTFLPQFVPKGVAVASWIFLLAAIHAVLVVLWFAILIAASVPLGRLLRRPSVVRTLDRVMGGLFIAFGARLALSRS